MLFTGKVVISSSFPVCNEVPNSTEDSDSDISAKKPAASNFKHNCFGEVKTSCYNRPLREEKAMQDREKIDTQ